jgi:hypothetical protein
MNDAPTSFQEPKQSPSKCGGLAGIGQLGADFRSKPGETTLFYQELKICKFEHSIETILLCASSIGCSIDNATYQICAIFNVQGFHLIVLSH